MVPHVVLARRDVEVAGQHQRRGLVPAADLVGQLLVKVHLVVELGVQRAVGRVAAGRNVEVLHVHARDAAGDAAGVTQLADLKRVVVLDGQARGDGDAMPALLAAHPQMRQAHLLERRARELVGGAFDLLQQQDVRRALGHEPRHLIDAQANRVYVPGGEAKRHGPRLSRPDASHLAGAQAASDPAPSVAPLVPARAAGGVAQLEQAGR